MSKDGIAPEDAARGIVYRLGQSLDVMLALRPGWFTAANPDTVQAIHNALVESSLASLRVLGYFLAKTKSADEVLAIDYLDSWRPEKDYLRHITQPISQHLSHALYVPKRGWPLGFMTREIVDGLGKFCDQLAQRNDAVHAERLSWFAEPVAQADELLTDVFEIRDR